MKFLQEFKEFAIKGNMMDMAVGVIIGGAFGKIISSLVNDIIMPPIGALVGNTDFSDLKIDLSSVRTAVTTVNKTVGNTIVDIASNVADSTKVASTVENIAATPEKVEPIYWCYGSFIQECVDFTILAFCVFLMVKIMNKVILKREAEKAKVAPPKEPSNEEKLLTEIRDLLKNK